MLHAAADLMARAFVRTRVRVRVGAKSLFRWRSLLRCSGGRVEIGEQSVITPRRIDFDGLDGSIRIGSRTFVGASHLVCRSEIVIGDDVLISWGVTIVDHDSHALEWDLRRDDVTNWLNGRKNWNDVKVARVMIGNKSWVGFGATILKGVSIGEGAVIGACSVVTRDVPPFTVVAGNPAREVRKLNTT
jgi:acetyltransferase-like isoleucine patch superfamily enzyme